MSTPADVESLSYEQAREELQDVVRRLENGAATLEESMQLWERGEALAARCQQWLDNARERLAKVQQPGAASPGTKELGTQEPGIQQPGTQEDEE